MDNVIRIDATDDPRLIPYSNLKERDLAKEHGLFIAEGEHVVRRLLASSFDVASVLLSEKRIEEIAPSVGADVPLYVLPAEKMHAVLGYKFHSGVMAAGVRPASQSFETIVAGQGDVALVICPELANAENLGTIIRLSAGFGATAVVLGERSCDPFLRQSIRVSMGTVFSIPIVQTRDIVSTLQYFKLHQVRLLATTLSPTAKPLRQTVRPKRFGILFGNEAQGLDDASISACDEQVTIPMYRGTDSLNVGVAAGIFLYHYLSG